MTLHATQLFALLLNGGLTEELLGAVERSRNAFIASGETDTWHFWEGLAHVASGRIEDALRICNSIADKEKSRALRIAATRARAEAEKNPDLLFQCLLTIYATDPDPVILFQLCEIAADKGDWTFIAQRARALLKDVPTPPAARLAIYASYEVGQNSLCLELMDETKGMFPTGETPLELKRLRVACEQKIGQVLSALRHAEAVANESQALQDKANLITLKLASGDPKGASIVAREFLTRRDVSPEGLLQIASLLRTEDPRLAHDFLDAAVQSGHSSPQFIAAAVGLAVNLDREDILRRLFPGFVQAAREETGPVKGLTTAEIKKMLNSARDRQMHAAKLYQEGRVPLHLAAQAFGAHASIADAFQRCLHPPRQQRPVIFIQHGGRHVQTSLPAISRLYLDITALLLADHIDILGRVENTFGEIFLPCNVSKVILEQLEKATPVQPSRIKHARTIRDLIQRQRIHVVHQSAERADDTELREKLGDEWCDLLTAAETEKGYLLTYVPVRHGLEQAMITLKPEQSKHVIGCGSLLAALAAAGKLRGPAVTHARDYLAVLTQDEERTSLELGRPLFITAGVAETLSGAQLLTAVTDNFNVFLHNREDETLRDTVAFDEWSVVLQNSLRRLLDRIRVGLERGAYRLMPLSEIKELQEEPVKQEPFALSQLTGAEPVTGACVWIDDRFLNAFRLCGKTPIVTVVDILMNLKGRNQLTEAELWTKLSQLRESTFRYIPIVDGEISYSLMQASFRDDEIVETQELKVLRSYTASCLSDRDHLQSPARSEGLPNPRGELDFVLTLYGASHNALIQLWSAPRSQGTSTVARADWILQNIWFDSTVVLSLMAPEERGDFNLVRGRAIAHLYIRGMSLPGGALRTDAQTRSPREEYFDWLQSRTPSDSATKRAVATHIANALSDPSLVAGVQMPDPKLARFVLGDFYTDLPQQIKDWMPLNERALRRIGIRQYTALETPKYKFKSTTFWRAAERAVRKGSARLMAQEPLEPFLLRVVRNGSDFRLHFEAKASIDSFQLADPIFACLARDPAAREKTLSASTTWFDGPEEFARTQIKEVCRIQDVPERMRRIHECRKRSPAFIYSTLQQKINARTQVFLSDLIPPPMARLVGHLRLKRTKDPITFSMELESAATLLIKDVGFDEAFLRLASLPVALPHSICRAFEELSADEQTSWIGRAIDTLLCPISRIHIFALCSRAKILNNRADELIDWFFGDIGQKAFNAFHRTLLWTLAEIEAQSNAEDLPAALVLCSAWTHAARIHNLLRHQSSDEMVAEFFNRVYKVKARDIFGTREDTLCDVAHPKHLTWTTLVAHGVSLISDRLESFAPKTKLLNVMHTWCFIRHAESLFPRVELLSSTRSYNNHLGSFLGLDRGVILAPFLGSEEAMRFGEAQLSSEIEGVISAIANEPKSEATWGLLYGLSGPRSVPANLRERAQSLVMKLRFKDIFGLRHNMNRLAMFWCVNCTKALGDSSVSQHIRTELFELAKHLANSEASAADTKQHADLMVDTVHFMATTKDGDTAAAAEFCSLLLKVIDLWPQGATEIWNILKRLLFQLPENVARELWPLTLHLRATAR